MTSHSKFFFILIEAVFFTAAILLVQDKTFLEIVLLGLASSFVGRAVAYLKVFEWLRAPFTHVVAHSAGVGETVEPLPNLTGWRYVISHLVSCPVCSGTWAAIALAILPMNLTYVLAAASIAWFVTYATEAIEWTKWKNWHIVGDIQNGNSYGTPITTELRELHQERASRDSA